jgi:hypothetical protein
MDPTPQGPAFADPIRGYERSQVEEFFAAAAVERAKLEAEIADCNERINRARSAAGMHRVMVAMLLDAQRELSELRRNAESEARSILADAEREAAAILASSGDPSPRPGFAAGTVESSEAAIDLATFESPASIPSVRLDGSSSNDASASDEYFHYLRGALADDDPLSAPAE